MKEQDPGDTARMRRASTPRDNSRRIGEGQTGRAGNRCCCPQQLSEIVLVVRSGTLNRIKNEPAVPGFAYIWRFRKSLY